MDTEERRNLEILAGWRRRLSPHVGGVSTVSELKVILDTPHLGVPHELKCILCDSFSSPRAYIVLERELVAGKAFVPQIIIAPSRFQCSEEPIVHLQPAVRLQAGFLAEEYDKATVELAKGRLLSNARTFRLKLQPAGERLPGGWLAKFPFDIPLEINSCAGEHSFNFLIDFPFLWNDAPRFFQLSVDFSVASPTLDAPASLTIRGGTNSFHGDLRGIRNLIIEDGVNDVSQMIPELLRETPDTSKEDRRMVCSLEVKRDLRPAFPRVHSALSRRELSVQRAAMFYSRREHPDYEDHRIYLFHKNEVSFGRRESGAIDVTTRFIPLPRSLEEECQKRQFNRDATKKISRLHFVAQLAEDGVLIKCRIDPDTGRIGRTHINGYPMKQNEICLDGHNTHRIELGGNSKASLPRYNLTCRLLSQWEDTNSCGVPALEDALAVTGGGGTLLKWSDRAASDAVVLKSLGANQQRFTVVILSRQIFLDIRGVVVEDPSTSLYGVAIRVFHASGNFFVQRIASRDLLTEVIVDQLSLEQYGVSGLQYGSELVFLRPDGSSLKFGWASPVFLLL